MLAKPVIFDGGTQRVLQQGDLLGGSDVIPATDTTNTNLTITGQMLLQKYIVRNPAGVSNENIDTAANIVAALTQQVGANVQNGFSWVFRWINISANALTLVAAANTGLTLTRGAIVAAVAGSNSGMKDFLITITNATPAQTFSGTTTNASAVIGGFTAAQLALLSVGMVVTNAQAGQQGNTIIGINTTAGGSGTITMSGNSNATNTVPVSFSFSPTVRIDGLAP